MRRLFVPICFGLLIALGVPSVQAGNQEEANRIAQRLTQQYPQYNIEVAYQEGTVRLRGDVASEADRDEIANFVRHIPKVRAVSETMNVTPNAFQQPAAIRPVQALTPVAQQPVVYGSEAQPVVQGTPPELRLAFRLTRLEPRPPFVPRATTSLRKALRPPPSRTAVRTSRITLGRAMRAIRITRRSLIRKLTKTTRSPMSDRSIPIRKFRLDGARSRCSGTTVTGGLISTTVPRMVRSPRSSVSGCNITNCIA